MLENDKSFYYCSYTDYYYTDNLTGLWLHGSGRFGIVTIFFLVSRFRFDCSLFSLFRLFGTTSDEQLCLDMYSLIILSFWDAGHTYTFIKGHVVTLTIYTSVVICSAFFINFTAFWAIINIWAAELFNIAITSTFRALGYRKCRRLFNSTSICFYIISHVRVNRILKNLIHLPFWSVLYSPLVDRISRYTPYSTTTTFPAEGIFKENVPRILKSKSIQYT